MPEQVLDIKIHLSHLFQASLRHEGVKSLHPAVRTCEVMHDYRELGKWVGNIVSKKLPSFPPTSS